MQGDRSTNSVYFLVAYTLIISPTTFLQCLVYSYWFLTSWFRSSRFNPGIRLLHFIAIVVSVHRQHPHICIYIIVCIDHYCIIITL